MQWLHLSYSACIHTIVSQILYFLASLALLFFLPMMSLFLTILPLFIFKYWCPSILPSQSFSFHSLSFSWAITLTYVVSTTTSMLISYLQLWKNIWVSGLYFHVLTAFSTLITSKHQSELITFPFLTYFFSYCLWFDW